MAMAKSIRKQVEAATIRKSKAVDAIYCYAEHGHMRFSECLERADPDLVAEYNAAVSSLIDLEYQAVSAGKAFRASSGMIIWN
jgi:hypothetical protein